MSRSLMLAMIVCAVLIVAVPGVGFAADTSPAKPSATVVQVLGIPLATATRKEARATLKQQGVPAVREDDRYWVDKYDAKNLLEGASELEIGYTMQSGHLAFMQYTFPAFVDPSKIKDVADMVAQKYGHPASSKGNVNLGSMEYDWNLKDGIKLVVARGWPDTTVFMEYKIPGIYNQMEAEVDENDKAEKQTTAKKQSDAF